MRQQFTTLTGAIEEYADSIFKYRHAGRSTINVSDVMLLARRNEGLESILRAFADGQHRVSAGSDGKSESE